MAFIAIALAIVVIGFFINLIVSANRAFENKADPDNRRLKALGADPAVSLKSTGSRLIKRTDTEGDLDSKTEIRTGPSVLLQYSMTDQETNPIDFYRRRLPRIGWVYAGESPFPDSQVPMTSFKKKVDDWNARLVVDDRGSQVLVTLYAPPVEEED